MLVSPRVVRPPRRGTEARISLVVLLVVSLVLVTLAWPAGARAALPGQSQVDLLTQANVQIDGAVLNGRAGYSVAGAGDVNGDGRSDVVVGAIQAINPGGAYVLFGRSSATIVDLGLLGEAGFRIDGAAASDQAGAAVAAAGDVNGDGLADVLVGAPSADANGRESSGSAYVVYGKASTDTVDLAALGTGRYVRIVGGAADDHAGASVAGAGDVNLDGRPDLIVGAYGNDPMGRPTAGSAYVVFGPTRPPSNADIDLAALGTGGFRIDGAAADDEAGASVAGPGDVNGDARPDVMVGARRADNNGRGSSGSAYVVFGKSGSATVDLAGLSTSGLRIDGGAANDGAAQSVAGAGDVNADGIADVALGAPGADITGRTSPGAAYVVFGRGSGVVDLAMLGAAGGYRIDGDSGDEVGSAIAAAGDVNGDGRPDIVVGGHFASHNGRGNSGSAYVVFGRPDAASVDLAVPGSGNLRIDGAAPIDQAGFAVGGAGDVNGDGHPDVIVGAHLADNNGRIDSGSAYVVYGFAQPVVTPPPPPPIPPPPPPSPSPSPSKPVNTSVPRISGVADRGKRLTCLPGRWAGSEPLTFTTTWRRGTRTIGHGRRHQVVTADIAHKLTCRIRATNAAGTATATSKPVKPKWDIVSMFVTGRLALGGVPPRVGCRGTMTLTLLKRKRPIARHTVKISPKCRWEYTFKVRRNKIGTSRTLTLRLHFSGNGAIDPATGEQHDKRGRPRPVRVPGA